MRNGSKCKQAAEDDRARSRTGVFHERVACRVCVVPHSRHDQICAVECDHTRLCQPRAWVRLLDSWVDAEDGNNDEEDEIECNEELVEHVRLAREEAIHQSREHRHARGRSDDDPLPEIRVGVFPVFETGFHPRVGTVDEKDQTDEKEDGGSEGCDQVVPEDEEAVRDEPGDDR